MRRAILVLAVVVAVAAVPVASSTAGPGGGEPVVLIPGWHGGAASFEAMVPALEAAGFTVVDFDPATPGAQGLSFAPTGHGQHIPYIAGKIVDEAIEDALARHGYGTGTRVDVVAYSMGGLVARFLVEQPGADVDSFSPGRGWFGDGVADVASGWAERIDDLVMLGTPNRGTFKAWVPGTIGGFGRWNASGGDMRPDSPFLRRMGTTEPPGERYVTVGGAPWYLPFPRHDHNGDGVAHGYDGLVPAESPFLDGAEQFVVPVNHAGLVSDPEALNLVVGALGRRHRVTGGEGEPVLTGAAGIRLEHAEVGADHDWGTDDEFRFDVLVDPDGGEDGFVPAGAIALERDAPFVHDWGDAGPLVGPVPLPGTSSRLDVRLDVWEHDAWRHQPVTTVVFRDVMLSDDLDGMDYYEAVVPLAGGRRHVFRISLNGVTSRPAG